MYNKLKHVLVILGYKLQLLDGGAVPGEMDRPSHAYAKNVNKKYLRRIHRAVWLLAESNESKRI